MLLHYLQAQQINADYISWKVIDQFFPEHLGCSNDKLIWVFFENEAEKTIELVNDEYLLSSLPTSFLTPYMQTKMFCGSFALELYANGHHRQNWRPPWI